MKWPQNRTLIFRLIDLPSDGHTPTWQNVFERLGRNLPVCETQNFVSGDHLLCLHVYIIHKLKALSQADEKITFLQIVYTSLEDYKSTYIEFLDKIKCQILKYYSYRKLGTILNRAWLSFGPYWSCAANRWCMSTRMRRNHCKRWHDICWPHRIHQMDGVMGYWALSGSKKTL